MRRVANTALLVGLPICCSGMVSPPRVLLLPLLIVSLKDARWQLVPSYIGWCAHMTGFSICGAVLGLLSLIADMVFPLPVVDGLDGSAESSTHGYSAGMVDYEWPFGPGPQDRCIGRMFYPTAKRTRWSPNARYIAFDDRHGLTRCFMKVAAPKQLRPFFPSWILQHWKVTTIPAEVPRAGTPTSRRPLSSPFARSSLSSVDRAPRWAALRSARPSGRR